MKKKPGTDEKAYVVCAKPNGVFFGYALPGETTGDQVTLRRARMLVKWSEATHSEKVERQCRMTYRR